MSSRHPNPPHLTAAAAPCVLWIGRPADGVLAIIVCFGILVVYSASGKT